MRNNSLVNDWLNDFQQKSMAEELAADKAEQAKRQELFQVVNMLMERKARQEQMAQQASQFAENLKLQKDKFRGEQAYRNARLGIEKQKLVGRSTGNNNINPALYSPEFEKKMNAKEVDRVDNIINSTNTIDFQDALKKIYNAREAIKVVNTGGAVSKGKKFFFENTGLDPQAAKAYSDISVLSGKEWTDMSSKIKGALSDRDAERVASSVFGMELDKKTNKELLNSMENSLLRLHQLKRFTNDYQDYHGTLKGLEKGWEKWINSKEGKDALIQEKEALYKEIGLGTPQMEVEPVKTNIEPTKQDTESLAGFGENMRQFGDALMQFPIDMYYNTVEGKEAPQLIPEEERNWAYTVGDIGSNLGGITGIAKLGAKAGIKSGLLQNLFASGAIESAKDYEDRGGGFAKGAALGLVGEGTAKVIGKAIDPLAKWGRKALTKGEKKSELAGLVEEEGKIAGDVYDKVLGKYKFGDNPSTKLVKGIQKEYKEAKKLSSNEYDKLLKSVDDSGFEISSKDLPQSVQHIFEKYKSETAGNLKAEDLHDVLKNLKQQKRANTRTLERGDNINVFELEKNEKLLDKAIDDLQKLMEQKVPGYKQRSIEHKKTVIPYTSTRTGKSIAKEEKDIPNFARKLNEGQEEGMRDLYKILPKKLKETAAAGEFIKGQNIVVKDTEKASKLYQDLMSKGTANARKTIEEKVGKGAGEQFSKLSKEIRDITEELKSLNAIKPDEDITKLVNYLSNGQVEKVTGLIERLLETKAGSGTIKVLEKLRDALNKDEGRLIRATLHSASQPDIEGE
jgi:hypothetical protein